MLNFLKSTIRLIRAVVLYLILICLVTFMVNNRDEILVHFYPLPFEIETRVFLIMLIFFTCGMIFGILACWPNMVSGLFKSFQDRRKIKKLEKKIVKN